MSIHRRESKEPDANMLVFSNIPGIFSHAVFNRHGGVSPQPWDSNNVSFGLGDSPGNVYINRDRIKKQLGFRRLVSARQAHGSQVYAVLEAPEQDIEINGFDALITNIPGIGLMIQQADCQAVLLFDQAAKAVGIAHVGWRGSVANIIAETVFAMSQAFATEPVNVTAAVSPSLGPCCAEFINYPNELPVAFHAYQVRPTYFDFWAITRDQLCASGIRQENIQVAGVCTCCSQDFFSYRRDRNTGRFGSAAGIK